MCEPFEIVFTGSTEELTAKAAKKLELQGGTLTGDIHTGRLAIILPFVGAIAGDYAISGQKITLTITDKPALLPCGMIESKIRDFLGS